MTGQVLIAGAGAAAGSAAKALRAGGFAGEVVVLGAEPWPPYNRTTVNKGLLAGAVTPVQVRLADMAELDVDWRDDPATGLQAGPGGPVVRSASGGTWRPDAVIVVTGARARTLPAGVVSEQALPRTRVLRTLADVAAVRELLTRAAGPARVVIAGGGLIGTESAGILRTAGHPVTLVDPAAVPMAPHLGPTAASWVQDRQGDAGVGHRQALVTSVTPETDGLRVELSDGGSVTADLLLVCLGVVPQTGWLAGSGLDLSDGVLVDDQLRALGADGQPAQGVWAAGDLARVHRPGGPAVRVEHWGSALGQGRHAGLAVLAVLDPSVHAAPAAYDELPSYATYVHEHKLTVLGRPAEAVTDRVLVAELARQRLTVGLLDARQRLVAAVGIGGARAVNRLGPALRRRLPVEQVLREQPWA